MSEVAAWSLERRYRMLLALYPAAHRAEHADEMVGVLLAGATGGTLAHLADLADLFGGAVRIWIWSVRQRYRRHGLLGLFGGLVRDERWSDALAVTSVVAPLLLLVSMLAQFGVPQAVASLVIGHPSLTVSMSVPDWPLTIGAPLLACLSLLGPRRLAGVVAVALALGQLFLLPTYSSPAIAFSVLLALTAAVGLLLSREAGRGLAVLRWWGVTSIAVVALILGGFSLGGFTLTGYLTDTWATAAPVPGGLSGLAPLQPTEVTGIGGDLLIASVLVLASAGCLFTAVGRRVLALFAVSMIPFAYIWADKLAADLIWSLEGINAIESSGVLLYLPSALIACVIVVVCRLGRRRGVSAAGVAVGSGVPGVVGAANVASIADVSRVAAVASAARPFVR